MPLLGSHSDLEQVVAPSHPAVLPLSLSLYLPPALARNRRPDKDVVLLDRVAHNHSLLPGTLSHQALDKDVDSLQLGFRCLPPTQHTPRVLVQVVVAEPPELATPNPFLLLGMLNNLVLEGGVFRLRVAVNVLLLNQPILKTWLYGLGVVTFLVVCLQYSNNLEPVDLQILSHRQYSNYLVPVNLRMLSHWQYSNHLVPVDLRMLSQLPNPKINYSRD